MPGPVADSVSRIVAAVLVVVGAGADASLTPLGTWPVYYDGNEPTDPDEVITVGDTSPVTDDRTFDGEFFERQGVMIRLRSYDPDRGYAKADAVRELIDKLKPNVYLVNGSRYRVTNLSRTTGVVSVGRTTPISDRLAWTINVLVNLRKL